MSYIDIVLGILLIIAAVRGFYKGFIVEAASLLALILGIWGAIHFSYFTADFLVNTFGWDSKNMSIIAFLMTFIVIIVVVHILGKILTKVVEALALGFLNHLAGLLLGVLKTALILSVLLLFLDKIDEEKNLISEEARQESQAYEPVKNLVPTLLPFLNFWDNPDLMVPEKSKEDEIQHKA